MSQARKPKGTSTGGQFAESLNPESTVDLSEEAFLAHDLQMIVAGDDSFDFGDGPVPAHRHSNGGGWVADTAHVEDTAFVGAHAKVCDQAEVLLGARISGHSIVDGRAMVCDNALIVDSVVRDDAVVNGDARVVDKSVVAGRAMVGGYSNVSGGAVITNDARVLDFASIDGSVISGMAKVSGHGHVFESSTLLSGNTTVTGHEALGNSRTGPEFDGYGWDEATGMTDGMDHELTPEIWAATVNELNYVGTTNKINNLRYEIVADTLRDVASDFEADPVAARAKYAFGETKEIQ